MSALSKIAVELGDHDEVVADFITNSKNNLHSLADEEASLREALTELPRDPPRRSGRPCQVERAVAHTATDPAQVDPRREEPEGRAGLLQKLGDNVTPLIRDDIRPFAR